MFVLCGRGTWEAVVLPITVVGEGHPVRVLVSFSLYYVVVTFFVLRKMWMRPLARARGALDMKVYGVACMPA